MVRGYYTAASGALTQLKSINMISNNLSNATTTGFKSQAQVIGTFGEHVAARMSSANKGQLVEKIGPGTFMAVTAGEYVDYTQGNIEANGINTNMAINGEGFFTVESEQFGTVLTRNGSFILDDEGFLVLPGVGKVLNDRGNPIQLETSNFTVSENGEIVDSEGDEMDTLGISKAKAEAVLQKIGEDCFYHADGYGTADSENFQVIGGARERSNVKVSDELVKLIASQRNFQSCTQTIKIYDKINEQSVELGSIG